MIDHIVLRVGRQDRFVPQLGHDTKLIEVAMDGAAGNAFSWVRAKVWRCIDAYALEPHPIATDLYRVAAAAYTADLRVDRSGAYDEWTRQLVLHIPVSDDTRWNSVKESLLRLLNFLTGDRWDVQFRPQAVPRPIPDAKYLGIHGKLSAEAVCLLSGGLDSFVGAIDVLATGRRVGLVSHNALGPHRFSSPAQRRVVEALIVAFGKDSLGHLKFFFDPPRVQAGHTVAETSQRGRSFLFFALGALTASAIAAGTPLIVPENGLITLNAPLTYARLGSWSTRTTHPHAISLLREIMAKVGLDIPVETPYNFRSKGQMLSECVRQDVLNAHARQTNSCGHSNDFNPPPNRRQDQCGYCVPCIIRRAALASANLDDPSDYRYDVLRERDTLSETKRSDATAFEVAIARARHRGVRFGDVLRSGKLIVPPADIPRYGAVWT